jgi:thiol-disulfide isomerase/thioredoxin
VKRRELIAGLGSVGILGGAGLVATGNLPGALSDSGSSPDAVEPVTLDTVDAPGSRDGEVTLPADGQPTFVDFFGTWCAPCVAQMPALAAAEDRVGDDVLFVSVTTEDVGGALSEEAVADWWRENDGDWLVAADVTAELAAKLNVGGYPTAVVLDSSRRIRWSESGTHTADDLVSHIEPVIDR